MKDELKELSRVEDNRETNIELIRLLNKQTFLKNARNETNFINNSRKKFYHILIYIFFFMSYLLYFLSLEKCNLGIGGCSREVMWMITKIIELIISCIIMSILIELIFFKLITKLHLLHIIIIFYFFYKYSHGIDFKNHGLFNFIGYFSLLIIILLFLIPLNLFICVMKGKNKTLKIIYIISFSLFIISIIIKYNISIVDCKDWPKGLNNSYIENNQSKYGCQIVFPKKCPYKIYNKIQDYTRLLRKRCENYKLDGSKKILLAKSKSLFLNKRVNRIGYPLTNKDPLCNLDMINGHNYIEEYFLNNLVDMENKNILEKYFKDKIPEVEVNFNNNSQGKIIINLNYNDTLSKERILLEKRVKPYSNNIMVLFIDSVSRANSIRHLKKTTKFIEQFMPFEGNFNKKYPNEVFHSFQFFKYHSFRLYTSYNFPILFYGQPKFSTKTLITKFLKENGYITGYTSDYCYKDNIRLHNNLTLSEVYDHQFLICDPNNDHYNIYTLKCLYGKPTVQHLFNYGLQFWRKYKNNRKFLTLISNDGHEGTLEVLKYIDDIIYNYLIELYNNNLLKDSSIFLLSDHGVGMPSFYNIYNFYYIEENLPMLYIIINDRKNMNYEQQFRNINENQQTFITGFDIYNTFGNIIYGDDYNSIKNKTLRNDTAKSEYGLSLFDKIDQKKRNPKFYQFSSTISSISCK